MAEHIPVSLNNISRHKLPWLDPCYIYDRRPASCPCQRVDEIHEIPSASVSMQPWSYSTDTKDGFFLPNIARSNFGKYLRGERYCAIDAVNYSLFIHGGLFAVCHSVRLSLFAKFMSFLFLIIFFKQNNLTE